MKNTITSLIALISISLNAQSSYNRNWAVNVPHLNGTFIYNSFLIDDHELYFPYNNEIRYYDLPNTTPIVFATLGTATTVTIEQIHRDYEGNIYILGLTSETSNFTTPNVYKPNYDVNLNIEGKNGFLAKFDDEGNLLFCTYTDMVDIGNPLSKKLITDSIGNIYFTGFLSISETIPNAPFQSTVTLAEQHWGMMPYAPIITKLNSAGELSWKTFFAHHNTFINFLDIVNNQLVVYGKFSKNYYYDLNDPTFFCTPGAFIDSNTPLSYNTFINVFQSDGTRAWGTYLSNGDAIGLRTHQNNIYVLHNNAMITPTENAYFQQPAANLLTKFNASGERLWTNTMDQDHFNLDQNGNVFYYFFTSQTNNIVTSDAYQISKDPTPTSYQTVNLDGTHQILSSDGTSLLYGTYYGLSGNDMTIAIHPTSTGYISMESVDSYQNATDFVSEGTLNYNSLNNSFEGLVITSFGKPSLTNQEYSLENLSVYPNPVEDQLIIENEFAFKDSDQVKVYNLLGQELKIDKQIDNQYIYINTTSWSSGIYLIEVLVDGKKGSYKVIKK